MFCLAAPSLLHAQSAKDLYESGLAHQEKDEDDKAIADFDQALAINPDHPGVHLARGIVWNKKGEYDKAIADFNELLRICPKFADAFYNRGVVWEKKREYDKAVADYSEALHLKSNVFYVCNNLAWLQATCPVEKLRNGTKALENAYRARTLYGHEHWRIAATIAAAHAENGEFSKAREWQENAITLVAIDKSATDADKKAMRSRLNIYKANKPYREPDKSEKLPGK